MRAISSDLDINNLLFLACLQQDLSPQQLSRADDLWNCTGPQWPEFRVHLQCNTHRQCDGDEDEVECRYRPCHQKGVQVADKCYMLGRPRTPLSWMRASHICKLDGGHLASVRSPEHKDHLMALFNDLGLRTIQVYIGLQTAPSSVPDM